ncbi:putative NAD-dependent epimerase/dehydratase family protein [Rhodobium orientis]|uniref:EBNA-1 nuclear protein n=1 Tax=Rhodobium orientis TaxID=34017 RepID=A0A327JMI9_9HYPH|nr:N-acetyltransferase DgcN [Rhodobium orientis]MBB4301960.1 putative NAD-dependent epimerase/dehydratase family protein [Rhodobium orientis]MBK5950197.1 EBNA-1 nuclear protein [Rhodobium orientis]RAI27261.1 EBNA-1 nuclear protein [Rhodobium orientis]
MSIKTPYVLFLGDAPDLLAGKVAVGIRQWRPEHCVGQIRLPGCKADCGLPDMTPAEAYQKGARTLVVGVANRGGVIAGNWISVLHDALECGLDIAAGLHNKVADIPELKAEADRLGRSIFDVRHPTKTFSVGKGSRRPGKRLLTVGTDCSCGKMFTTLAIEKEMRARGMDADFRATGQTGILIVGDGVSVDAVVSDFISGCIEDLTPDAADDHWDVIEGQGSLFHPSFAGVTTGLIHGAQPDALVLCHEPTRTHMRGVPDFALPGLEECMDLNLRTARLTNPDVRFVGVSMDTSRLGEDEALRLLEDTGTRLGLPAVDPVRIGVGPIVDTLG